jgi:small conductance mechanosensitive channel
MTMENIKQQLADFMQDPSAIYPFLWRLGSALLVFWIGRRVIKLLTGLVMKGLRKMDADETLVRFISKLVYYLLLVVLIVSVLGMLGIETTSFLAILGAAGLAVGLALKDSLSNFASGVMIILFRPFRVDDLVEIAGKTGVVEEIGIFSTRMKTTDNRQIIIPNGQIMGEAIINYTAKPIRRVDLPIGVSYDDDLKKAREIMLATVSAHPQVLEDPAPSILLTELGDSSVNFSVRPWCHTGDYWTVRSDLLEQLKVNLKAGGCSIPYPQRDVHLYPQDSAS